MVEVAVVLVAATLVVSVAIVAAYAVSMFRVTTRRTAIVNTKTDQAFRGVLWKVRGRLIVLRNAQIYTGGESKPVDGEVVLDRSNVDFIQIITGS